MSFLSKLFGLKKSRTSKYPAQLVAIVDLLDNCPDEWQKSRYETIYHETGISIYGGLDSSTQVEFRGTDLLSEGDIFPTAGQLYVYRAYRRWTARNAALSSRKMLTEIDLHTQKKIANGRKEELQRELEYIERRLKE